MCYNLFPFLSGTSRFPGWYESGSKWADPEPALETLDLLKWAWGLHSGNEDDWTLTDGLCGESRIGNARVAIRPPLSSSLMDTVPEMHWTSSDLPRLACSTYQAKHIGFGWAESGIPCYTKF